MRRAHGGVTSMPRSSLSGVPAASSVTPCSVAVARRSGRAGIGHEVGQFADAQPRQLPARGLQPRVLEVTHRAPADVRGHRAAEQRAISSDSDQGQPSGR